MTSRLARLWPLAVCLGLSEWQVARPDYRWEFPRDHWAHPAYKTEWWYVTGQVADSADPARRFGYQVTFFRIGVLPKPPALGSDWAAQMIVMAHAAVTDVGAQRHTFSDALYRATPLLGGFGAPGDSVIAWSRAPAGTPGRWTLRYDRGAFAFHVQDDRRGIAFDLRAVPDKPLAFQGPNGFSRKGPGPTSASQYYSFTRMATTGTLTTGGRTSAVRGSSWMDQEVGSNQLGEDQVGWDWFGLQLDDGRELMLYVLRDSTGATSWASGTVVARDGRARWIDSTAFTTRATATWRSDSTAATYPARWTVRVPSENLEFEVVPLVAAQENRSAIPRGLYYWEGAVELRAGARVIGRGYVELTGYGNGIKPAL